MFVKGILQIFFESPDPAESTPYPAESLSSRTTEREVFGSEAGMPTGIPEVGAKRWIGISA